MPLDWTQPLPREQIRPFLARSDLAGWRMLAFNWALIAACFGLVMWRANPLTVAAALIVLGGRQLGLGILMHETAHRSLFRTAFLNEWVGHWLCAARTLSARTLLRNSWRCVLANAVMLAVCAAAGHALAYLLWPAAWLTTYMLYSRIRNVAEHGALPGTREADIWRNTRTVLAAWWERLTVAPNYVNYHFEHHLLPAVPAWQLPRFHRWLREQGAYEQGAPLEHGYVQVLKRMTR